MLHDSWWNTLRIFMKNSLDYVHFSIPIFSMEFRPKPTLSPPALVLDDSNWYMIECLFLKICEVAAWRKPHNHLMQSWHSNHDITLTNCTSVQIYFQSSKIFLWQIKYLCTLNPQILHLTWESSSKIQHNSYLKTTDPVEPWFKPHHVLMHWKNARWSQIDSLR